jgi:tol-pal system protein YbgF
MRPAGSYQSAAGSRCRRSIVWAIAVAAAFAGPAVRPADAANREHEQLMADIRILQEQTQQLQVVLGTVTESIKAVNARLDEQAAAERKALADHKLLVDTLSSDVRVVREKIDETNVRIASLTQDVEGLRELIPPPGMQPQPAGSPENPISGGEQTPATSGTAPANAPTALGMSPRKLYEQAFADYAGGQWSIAIQGFEMYLKTYPKSELADDAQYYIGESYAGASNHKAAAAAYQRVINEYPNSDMLPEAWYKLGLSYDRLGQPDQARAAFEDVIKKYPQSAAGGLARQGLERLNRRR